MSAGRAAYEADLARQPLYHDGTHRNAWGALDDVLRWSWNRDPTPRPFPPLAQAGLYHANRGAHRNAAALACIIQALEASL